MLLSHLFIFISILVLRIKNLNVVVVFLSELVAMFAHKEHVFCPKNLFQ